MKKLSKKERPLALSARGEYFKSRAGKHGEDVVLTRAAQIHNSFVKTYDSLVKMTENPDPLLPDAANRVRVSRAAKEAIGRLKKNTDAIFNDIQRRQVEIGAEISSRIGLKETPHGAEIRAIFRGMSATERGRKITAAIDVGDSEVLSAVLLGHPLTVGMTFNDVEKYHERAERAFAGDLAKLRDTLSDAQNLLVDALAASVGVAEEIEGDYQERTELRQKREAAEGAEKDLNAAFSV